VQKKTSNATKQMAAMSCLQHLDLVLWVVEPKHALKSRESVVAESQKWPWTGVPESTPDGSGVFLSGPKPESKFFEKRDPDPESVFNFGNGSSLHGHFLNKKIDFGWIHSSQSLNRSRILKFKKFLDPDSKTLEQERSRSLKKWLRPPLPQVVPHSSV